MADPVPEAEMPTFVAYAGSPGGANQALTFVPSGPLAYGKLSCNITTACAPYVTINNSIMLPSSLSFVFIFFCRVVG